MRTKVIQSNLNSGILSPTAIARVDTNKYYKSVQDAVNTTCHPHGGQAKRLGTKYIATLAGDGRLVKFAFNVSQAYILVFTANNIAVYDVNDDSFVQDITTTYTLQEINELGFAQSADTMILTHGNHVPRKVLRDTTTGTWSISDISLQNIPRYDYSGTLDYDLQNTGVTQTVNIKIGDKVFNKSDAFGTQFHVYEALTARTNIDLATDDYSNVTNWTDLGLIEAVISSTRGWPKYCTFYEARLWFAGLKSRPQTILGSVTNDFYNLNVGTGLADEAIYDTLDTDQINPIVNIFPGRQLQVFTEGGEFSNSGKPITPEDSAWTRSTNYGSIAGIRNDLLDGSTLFVDRTGRNLREFVYNFSEDAYTAQSASTLAYDIISKPIDTTVVRGTSRDISNLVLLVNDDGTIAVFNTLRIEEVAGWTRWLTNGLFKSAESVYDKLYFIVSRDNGFFLERKQEDVYTDASVTDSVGGVTISGLDHLEGQEVQIVADGSVMNPKTVSGGTVTLEREFITATVGLGYDAVIETLPISPNLGGGSSVNREKKILKNTFRLHETQEMKVNGEVISFRQYGQDQFDSTPAPFSGLKEIRQLGYGNLKNITITSDTPTPFWLLGIETEVQTK